MKNEKTSMAFENGGGPFLFCFAVFARHDNGNEQNCRVQRNECTGLMMVVFISF